MVFHLMTDNEFNSFLNKGGYPLTTIHRFLIDEIRRLADVYFALKEYDVLYLHESVFCVVAKKFRESGYDKNKFPFKLTFRKATIEKLIQLI